MVLKGIHFIIKCMQSLLAIWFIKKSTVHWILNISFQQYRESHSDSGLPFTHFVAQTNLKLTEMFITQSLSAVCTHFILSLAAKKMGPGPIICQRWCAILVTVRSLWTLGERIQPLWLSLYYLNNLSCDWTYYSSCLYLRQGTIIYPK